MNLPENTNVLVTGGAGYIGSTLVSLLLEEGYQVRVIDNLLHGGNALLPFLSHPRFDLNIGDIRDVSSVDAALENINGVVHLAAIVGEPACNQDPDLTLAVNKKGSELLCEIAIKRGVKRFVFASTCSNYGVMSNPDSYVNEDSPLQPLSVYAETKVGFEQHLLQLPKTKLSAVCLRFATAHGLSLRPRFDLTANEFSKELALKRQLEVYGEHFWRPYCHISDLARACLAALKVDHEVVACEAFNVGATSENYQKKTVVDLILKILPQARENVVFIERNEDPRNYRVNFDKIKSNLGFIPVRNLNDGVSEIIWAVTSGLITNPDDRYYRNI